MKHVIKVGELKNYTYSGQRKTDIIDNTIDSKTNKLIVDQATWMGFTLASDGLFSLLTDGGELIKESSEFALLTKDHKAKINAAHLKINELPPEYGEILQWLNFWVNWSFENCKQPAIGNWFI